MKKVILCLTIFAIFGISYICESSQQPSRWPSLGKRLYLDPAKTQANNMRFVQEIENKYGNMLPIISQAEAERLVEQMRKSHGHIDKNISDYKRVKTILKQPLNHNAMYHFALDMMPSINPTPPANSEKFATAPLAYDPNELTERIAQLEKTMDKNPEAPFLGKETIAFVRNLEREYANNVAINEDLAIAEISKMSQENKDVHGLVNKYKQAKHLLKEPINITALYHAAADMYLSSLTKGLEKLQEQITDLDQPFMGSAKSFSTTPSSMSPTRPVSPGHTISSPAARPHTATPSSLKQQSSSDDDQDYLEMTDQLDLPL